MEIIRACDDSLLAIFTEAQQRAGSLDALMQPLPSRLQLKHEFRLRNQDVTKFTQARLWSDMSLPGGLFTEKL
jgi:hypothetical protein